MPVLFLLASIFFLAVLAVVGLDAEPVVTRLADSGYDDNLRDLSISLSLALSAIE